MTLAFNLAEVQTTEFGVGRTDGKERIFETVPVEAEVKATLLEMVKATWAAMHSHPDGALNYEPSQEHRSTEYLFVSKEAGWDEEIRLLHDAENLPPNPGVLIKARHIFYYFARMTDGYGRRRTGIRRASQFKAI